VKWFLKELENKMLNADVVSGSLVSFDLRSVVCPDSEDILCKASGNLELSGTVVLFSDDGSNKDYYAVVEVDGIATPLIVPVNNIRRQVKTASWKGF